MTSAAAAGQPKQLQQQHQQPQPQQARRRGRPPKTAPRGPPHPAEDGGPSPEEGPSGGPANPKSAAATAPAEAAAAGSDTSRGSGSSSGSDGEETEERPAPRLLRRTPARGKAAAAATQQQQEQQHSSGETPNDGPPSALPRRSPRMQQHTEAVGTSINSSNSSSGSSNSGGRGARVRRQSLSAALAPETAAAEGEAAGKGTPATEEAEGEEEVPRRSSRLSGLPQKTSSTGSSTGPPPGGHPLSGGSKKDTPGVPVGPQKIRAAPTLLEGPPARRRRVGPPPGGSEAATAAIKKEAAAGGQFRADFGGIEACRLREVKGEEAASRLGCLLRDKQTLSKEANEWRRSIRALVQQQQRQQQQQQQQHPRGGRGKQQQQKLLPLVYCPYMPEGDGGQTGQGPLYREVLQCVRGGFVSPHIQVSEGLLGFLHFLCVFVFLATSRG